MNNIRLCLFDLLRRTEQKNLYEKNMHVLHISKKNILDYWAKAKNEIVNFHIANNKEYAALLEAKGVDLKNWKFEDLPILTKKDLSTKMAVTSEIFKWSHTGGSSGNPFSYPLSKKAASALWPNLWRAFSVCGIKPCDHVMMIAGPSLFNNRSFKRKIFDFINRFTVVSAFDLNDDVLQAAVEKIKKGKIKAIYGYTSSVLVFLEYLAARREHLSLKGIFTTSETFIPKVRSLAKEYCNCEVIDIYGANDGGICAFECKAHQGYHISFERTFLEIVDHKIILTDLYNTAFPFIRYEVGDMTSSEQVEMDSCECGCNLFRIQNIAGRINSYITDLDGTKIHTEFFSHIFHDDPLIEQYQITDGKNTIVVNVHCEETNKVELETKYLSLVQQRFKKNVSFDFNKPFVRLKNQKTPILVQSLNN